VRVCAVMGFVVCTVTFGACGFWYDTLSSSGYLTLFQVLYYLSSFFGQVRQALVIQCAATTHTHSENRLRATVPMLCVVGAVGTQRDDLAAAL
jgi:hypothetical protein